MIKANDLRIGNWVLIYNKEFWKCKGIDEHLFHVEYKDYVKDSYSLAAVEGIPLTHELFEQAGFESTSKGHYRRRDLGEVYLKHTPQCFLVKMYPSTPVTSVKYLHQLQNLYFALTGNELDITL